MSKLRTIRDSIRAWERNTGALERLAAACPQNEESVSATNPASENGHGRVAAILSEAQLAAVLETLSDAAEAKREAAGGYCHDCNESPVELCLPMRSCCSKGRSVRRPGRGAGGRRP